MILTISCSPNKAVVEQLHEGIQCHTCATRFVAGDHEKYRAHLDWHFRQNKLEQEMEKVAKNRKWFYSISVSCETATTFMSSCCYGCELNHVSFFHQKR